MSASLDQVICWSFVGNLSVLEVSEIQIFCCMFTSFDQYHVSVVEARSLLTACEKFRAPLTANCFVLWEQLAGQCGPASVVRLAQEQPRASILALNAFSLLLALFGEHFADPSIFPQSSTLRPGGRMWISDTSPADTGGPVAEGQIECAWKLKPPTLQGTGNPKFRF